MGAIMSKFKTTKAFCLVLIMAMVATANSTWQLRDTLNKTVKSYTEMRNQLANLALGGVGVTALFYAVCNATNFDPSKSDVTDFGMVSKVVTIGLAAAAYYYETQRQSALDELQKLTKS